MQELLKFLLFCLTSRHELSIPDSSLDRTAFSFSRLVEMRENNEIFPSPANRREPDFVNSADLISIIFVRITLNYKL